MFYYENVSVKSSGKDKVSRHGTPIAELVSHVVIKHTSTCELRECSFNGKFTCFEIYLEGEFLVKTDNKKKALSLFRDFSAV